MKPTEFSGRIVEWNSYRLLSPAGVWQGSNSYANAAGRRAVPQDGCGQELPSLQAATVRAAQRAGSHGGRGCGQFQTGRLMSCRDCRARHDELRWDGIFFASGACRTWAAAGWMEWRGRHQNSTGRKSGEKHTQAAVICLRLGYPREPQEVDMPLVDKQRQWHRRVLWMELAPGEGGLCCPCCVYCTVRHSYNIIPGTVTRYSLPEPLYEHRAPLLLHPVTITSYSSVHLAALTPASQGTHHSHLLSLSFSLLPSWDSQLSSTFTSAHIGLPPPPCISLLLFPLSLSSSSHHLSRLRPAF